MPMGMLVIPNPAAAFADGGEGSAFVFPLAIAVRKPRYTHLVYARKLRVDVLVGAERRLCPLDWLDNFCMRDFTGRAEFDDTLPVADGLLEAGFRVQPERLADAMSAWFTRRGKGHGEPVRIEIHPA